MVCSWRLDSGEGCEISFPRTSPFFSPVYLSVPTFWEPKQGGASDIIFLGIIQTPNASLELQRRPSKKLRQFGGWSNKVQKMNRDHRIVLLPIIFIMGLFTSIPHRHDRVDTCGILVGYLLNNALLSLKDMKFTISQFLHLSKNIKWKHGRHISTRPSREWCKGITDGLFLWETDLVKMTDIVKLRRPRRKANLTSGLKTQRDFWTGPSNLYWPAARVLSISFCLVFDISAEKYLFN